MRCPIRRLRNAFPGEAEHGAGGDSRGSENAAISASATCRPRLRPLGGGVGTQLGVAASPAHPESGSHLGGLSLKAGAEGGERLGLRK